MPLFVCILAVFPVAYNQSARFNVSTGSCKLFQIVKPKDIHIHLSIKYNWKRRKDVGVGQIAKTKEGALHE